MRHASKLLCTAAIAMAAVQAPPPPGEPGIISVEWMNVTRALRTVNAFQTVVNVATVRDAPFHDAIYERIASLGAPYQRYVPWLLYPKLGVAELEPPSHGGLCGFVNSGGPSGIWSTTIDCASRGAGIIDSVVFANYGQPTGYCNSLKAAPACSRDVSSVVADRCVGQGMCTLVSNDAVFGAAPCTDSRLAVEVTCSNKAVTVFTYWDFSLIDEGMLDFIKAANASGRSSIPNLSTPPNWLFVNDDRTYYPDDPLGITGGYEKGVALADPSGRAFGDYYGRLVAHYVEGGFTDEAGAWVPGFNLSFSHWEVLNEVNAEHQLSPPLYTLIYDAVVAGIRRWAPRGSKNMKFVGIGGAGDGYIPYFLNKSNHAPGTPIDVISLHHYGGSATRDGGDGVVPGADYCAFFAAGAGFIGSLASDYARIAASDYPDVMIDADEVGVILPDDDDPKWTADEPGFPSLYWNAAAAQFAYLFGMGAGIGLDVLGMSQLTGYPSFVINRGPPINGPWTAVTINPSVSMLMWPSNSSAGGDGTARYWILKLLIDSFRAGPPAGTTAPAEADVLVATNTSGAGRSISSPFCAEQINLSTLKMYCATGIINNITFADYGTPTGTCGSWAVNPACSAVNGSTIVREACVGRTSCSINTDTPTFGDPCFGVVKRLVVEATCSTGGGAQIVPPAVYAQAFVEGGGGGGRKALVVNMDASPHNVTLAGAAGGSWAVVDASTGYGPAATSVLEADTWLLAPFAAGVLRL